MPENKIEIYTSPLCGYCHAAKRLLKKHKLNFIEYDVLMQPAMRKEMRARSNGKNSIPQIFINSKNIGGYTELNELDRSNELESLFS